MSNSFFMSLACIIADKSKDPHTKVGAVIVNDRSEIISAGWNSMPYVERGDNDQIYPWAREGEDELDTKYPYVIHAEANAIICARGEGTVLYTTMAPCNECAKLITLSQIQAIWYLTDPYRDTRSRKAANIILAHAKIKQFQADCQVIRKRLDQMKGLADAMLLSVSARKAKGS